MAQTPRGTRLFVSKALAAPISINSITNAKPAVVTAPGHGLVAGQYVILNTNWGRMSDRAFKVESVIGDAFVIKDSDTTNVEFYTPGGGVGSLQAVVTADLVQITKVTGFQSSGGDPKKVSYYYLENETDFELNDGFNAVSYTVTLDADAITTAGYQLLRELTENGRKAIFVLRTKSGSEIIMPVDVALNETPSITDGQIMTNTCAFNGKNRPVRYAGA